ncbi:pancreatic secretory granule membrane major glycoprotein GP2-like isoform X2 [Silurus meridionalis]|uniref:pancreatic secretory granule membrane major glycoprotein GP2-like isoform X2 n=1 Tax=Silurus meridionalis TaxID=175797 RepID=UPI001EE9F367|nr:pancreatic secretory granule membrane major glycoprotein GP2-like isoform X2 [Silurus meridionalis]
MRFQILCVLIIYVDVTTEETSEHDDEPCEILSCSENEYCGEKNGIHGCFCNVDHHRPNPDFYDATEMCDGSSGTMSLSRCQLFEAGFPDNKLHLNDPSCRGTVQNDRLVFHFDNDNHICGTHLTANGTHIIYENRILGELDTAGGIINRKKTLELSFSCVYQLNKTLSMDTELNPIQSIVNRHIPDGVGMYQVTMIPYMDAGFSHPYTGSVNIMVGESIYIEVSVQGVDSRQIALVMDTCWATPVNEKHYPVHWDLITQKCPNPKDRTVEVLKNGLFTTGRFSFKMFSFHEDEPKVFLHCSIHLCLLKDQNCAVVCPARKHGRPGRSTNIHDSASISIGPFIWSTKNKGF